MTRAAAASVRVGAAVLHQHRDELGNSVIDRHPLVRIRGGTASLKRHGGRRRTCVPLDTRRSAAAWALQEALW